MSTRKPAIRLRHAAGLKKRKLSCRNVVSPSLAGFSVLVNPFTEKAQAPCTLKTFEWAMLAGSLSPRDLPVSPVLGLQACYLVHFVYLEIELGSQCLNYKQLLTKPSLLPSAVLLTRRTAWLQKPYGFFPVHIFQAS